MPTGGPRTLRDRDLTVARLRVSPRPVRRLSSSAAVALILAMCCAGCSFSLDDAEVFPTSRSTPSESSDGVNGPEEPGGAPIDSGATVGATGPVASAPDSQLIYTVASGDSAAQIAARFNVELDQLVSADGERLGSYPVIHPDDVIGFGARLSGEARDCFYGLPDSTKELAECREKYSF